MLIKSLTLEIAFLNPKQCENLTHKVRSDAQIAVIEKNKRFLLMIIFQKISSLELTNCFMNIS